jgi:hypothetical protein
LSTWKIQSKQCVSDPAVKTSARSGPTTLTTAPGNQQFTLARGVLQAGRAMKLRDSGGQQEWDSTWEVALKILRYLAENPNAADTADGVLEWWVLKQSIFEEEEVVERALDRLVEHNLIHSVQLADARKHYHLNADRIEESKRLIKEAKDREGQ